MNPWLPTNQQTASSFFSFLFAFWKLLLHWPKELAWLNADHLAWLEHCDAEVCCLSNHPFQFIHRHSAGVWLQVPDETSNTMNSPKVCQASPIESSSSDKDQNYQMYVWSQSVSTNGQDVHWAENHPTCNTLGDSFAKGVIRSWTSSRLVGSLL